MDNIRCALRNRVVPVVGTTGLSDQDIREVKAVHGVLEPEPLSLGIRRRQPDDPFFPESRPLFLGAEIIELHHDGKADAPSAPPYAQPRDVGSGGGGSTTQLLAKPSWKALEENQWYSYHSVRLPGLVAHQEVILEVSGHPTIRHDSINRESLYAWCDNGYKAPKIRPRGGRRQINGFVMR